MAYLLDTHTFLWWITNDSRLPQRVRDIIREPENTVYFSAASAWEIAIKAQLGRIGFESDVVEAVPRQLAINGFSILPIGVEHAFQVSKLPFLHQDPFDRLLVAQSLHDQLPLLTADPLISQYHIVVIW